MARILVVEDSESYAEYTRAVLARGHDVAIARNGREAAIAAGDAGVDLIITDIFMPEVDGFELIRTMRERASDIPIIAMSGVDRCRLDLLHIATKLGAVHTIQKPCPPAELIRVVEIVLGRREPWRRALTR
jgi:DNA-binding response OmpR family regulator